MGQRSTTAVENDGGGGRCPPCCTRPSQWWWGGCVCFWTTYRRGRMRPGQCEIRRGGPPTPPVWSQLLGGF